MHGMPEYCDAMRSEMKPGDVLLVEQASGPGMTVRYRLPHPSETLSDGEQSPDFRFDESYRSVPSAHPKDSLSCPRARAVSFGADAHRLIERQRRHLVLAQGRRPLKKPQAFAHCGSPSSKIDCL
jgi:hypothetical protein